MQNKEGLNWEVSVGVTFSAFMSAVALFFVGVLIAQFGDFDRTVRVPLIFLIISTFSFIFSASIYSKAGIEITEGKQHNVQDYLVYANNIFEFMGLNLFVLSTPLVIGAITTDRLLRISTIIVALVGLSAYSLSRFSILHKETIDKMHQKVVVFAGTTLSLGLYMTQFAIQSKQVLFYYWVALMVLLANIGLTIHYCKRTNQYRR